MTLAEQIQQLVDKLKAAIPAGLQSQFNPVIDNAATALLGWSGETLNAWIALAKTQPDVATQQLLSAMGDAALTAQTEVDGAALDTAVSSAADDVARGRVIFQSAIAALFTVIAGAL
jgi:hypothetical protein